MSKIKKGTKIKTNPIIYEIEVIYLSREILIDEEIDFIEWLSYQPNNCPCGKNFEYFRCNDNHMDDIGVEFYIKIKE